jgi:dipeptidyl aminopeptidase/acylaminoacyl peptidase
MKINRIAFSAFVIAISIMCAAALPAQTKRPLRHTDYDAWRDIHSQKLSPNGNFVVYGLFPQEGDGEVVVRNLKTGAEFRTPAGMRPEPKPPDPDVENPVEEERPQRPNITVQFTADSHFVIFSTFAPKAEIEKAKREKKKADEMPKGGLAILNLDSGSTVQVPQIKSFRVPEKSPSLVAYLRQPASPGAKTASAKQREEESAAETPAGETSPVKRSAKREYGSELVLRNLVSGQERTFADVTEYLLAKDGTLLVYAVSSKQEESNGVYTVATDNKEAKPSALLAGPGKYAKLTFDEQDKRLAFLSDLGKAAKRPSFKLYLWERNTPSAVAVVTSAMPGFQENVELSDKGTVAFSRDGERIFFGCAPVSPDVSEENAGKSAGEDEKVLVDLWHWKDDYIQPMQKVRAERDKTRTYRAVYHIAEKKLVQLADRTMSEIVVSEDGRWALGGDDREYRSASEYDERHLDSYLVNTLTGQRIPLLKKHLGQPTWSPGGKYVLYFNDKHWVTVSVPKGTTAILQTQDGIRLDRDDYDRPSTPPPYGAAGWTKDGKYVLLYDEFDVWRVTPDGTEAVNLTRGLGRMNQLRFRVVRAEADRDDPDSKWIDSSQPLLLRAEDKETHNTGFYRAGMDGRAEPQKLMMGPKSFSEPTKAKNTDVFLLTASTFEEFPDLLITDSSFSKLTKISNANPQKSQFLWGTAELIHYRNIDGVPLSGILYKPENFDPNKKYPMLVYIYEKLSQNVHNFIEPKPNHSIVPTYYVSNGYLVLEPDIVYTIGQPGQSALKCVMAAIDAVSDKGFVDEKAIGIQGHSWGGYQIAYMVTQTSRFRAAAAGAAVSNMISAYDGIRWGPGRPRQFQYEHEQSRIGGSLWQMPLRYIENSPIFGADRVTTPLLLLHNDADDAVPWYQGIEYFLALRRLGKEVYMFSYNGEPHGLRRRPDQKDYTVRLQQFFDHFLKGGPTPEWMEKGIPYLDRDAEKERLKSTAGVY